MKYILRETRYEIQYDSITMKNQTQKEGQKSQVKNLLWFGKIRMYYKEIPIK